VLGIDRLLGAVGEIISFAGSAGECHKRTNEEESYQRETGARKPDDRELDIDITFREKKKSQKRTTVLQGRED